MPAKSDEMKAKSTNEEEVKISDGQLEVWAAEQRVKYRNGELSPHQIRKIEEISGWSWQIDETVNR